VRHRKWTFVLLAAAASSDALADDQDPVVLRVGDSVLRSSDVGRRIASIPRYQLASLGRSPDEIRHRFLETVLVPELLYAAEASRQKLETRADVLARIRDARRRAIVDQIRKERAAEGVPEDEIQAFFVAHRDEFQKPERIRISRIVTDDEALARRIVAEARGVGGPERWTKLAREHSQDEATKMRGGNLGFVFPDGRTDVPQVRVDPALYTAASSVKDGEIVAEPVKEGDRFSVVWRRGTLPKTSRTVDDERARIREVLLAKRVEDAVQALLEQLRKKFLGSAEPDLLEGPLPGEAASGSVPPVPRASGSADPVPRHTDRGLR
jgi:hypothetical protein